MPANLILDQHTSHKHKDVLHYFHEFDTEVDFLPPCSTDTLQVMDVGINKIFKERLKSKYWNWLITVPEGSKPNRKEISHWCKDVWDSIDMCTIRNTWDYIGYHDYKSDRKSKVLEVELDD